MLNWFARRLAQTGKRVGREEKGFTLIELLVVVIIIGILAAIAIPIFLNQRDSAQDSAAQSNLRNAASAQQSYFTDQEVYTSVVSDLEDYGFPQDGSVTIVTPASGTGASYCMEANGSSTFSIRNTDGTPQNSSC